MGAALERNQRMDVREVKHVEQNAPQLELKGENGQSTSLKTEKSATRRKMEGVRRDCQTPAKL